MLQDGLYWHAQLSFRSDYNPRLGSLVTMRLLFVCSALLGFADAFLNPRPSGVPVLHQRGGKFPKCVSLSMTTISNNPELQPGIDAIDAANPFLHETLSHLRYDSYFRLYSVDILASCEYIPQELFECYSETCEIYPVDEDEVSRN